jgi:anti-sigma regulatory factor (Ser/Thr protein kinase)
MEVTRYAVIAVADASQVGEARRWASALAQKQGFDEAGVGRVAIAVTEAGTNLVKHGHGGEIHLSTLVAGDARGVAVIALDRGQGIERLADAVRDGFSTGGTAGTGLGAIARQAGEFDLYSVRGEGTALLACFWTERPVATGPGLAVGGVSVPKPGEEDCGDGWAVARANGRTLILVADGLGHGSGAAEATRRALDVFRATVAESPAEIMRRIHEGLRATRGAAAAVVEVNRRGVVRFAGIGNVSATIVDDGTTRSLVSHHGTLGHDVRKIQQFEYPWPAGGMLVLHSDGIGSRWTLARYPGLARRHPALVAAVLYRDFRRGSDDATVVVGRDTP